MNWTKLEAILRQAYPGLVQQIQRKLPSGVFFQSGIDQDPPCIILLFGIEHESGRQHPLLGNIKQKLSKEDLAPLYELMAPILRTFPELRFKSKIQAGVLAYKLWRD